jgi:small subunit ribosomal protein S8
MDKFADAINKIKTNERIGRQECVVDSTKLMKTFLDLLKRESYISGYEEFVDRKFKMLRIKLANRINSIGVIKPRYAVQCAEIQKYEMRYIPSGNFGLLIISTPQGVMTNKQAKEKSTGGRLLAYVY